MGDFASAVNIYFDLKAVTLPRMANAIVICYDGKDGKLRGQKLQEKGMMVALIEIQVRKCCSNHI